MIVMKFGGSSVGNSSRINSVISILQTRITNKENITVVFSAFQTVTDSLIEIGNIALKRDLNYKIKFESLEKLHYQIIDELNLGLDIKVLQKKVASLFEELSEILHGVYLVKELTPKSLDYIVSFGEQLSCTIISESMINRGIECENLNASKIIKTDNDFGKARVNFKLTNKNISKYFKKHKMIQIVTGFISSTEENEITTLGRGGSDYTAAIIGAAIDADAIEIWTDVDGILTADPRKVTDAFSLKSVTYEEAMELSHFGAKVIYPPTMLPALEKKVKIIIKNTFNPECAGTMIVEKSKEEDGARRKSDGFLVKGISSIDNVSLIRVQGSGMIGVSGIASRLFTALALHKINIILITQASSEHSICLAVLPEHGEKGKTILKKEFRLELLDKIIGEITVEDNLSIIAVVGEKMRHSPGIAGKIFMALGDNSININAIAQGSSELNISLVISKKDLGKALNAIHSDIIMRRE